MFDILMCRTSVIPNISILKKRNILEDQRRKTNKDFFTGHKLEKQIVS